MKNTLVKGEQLIRLAKTLSAFITYFIRFYNACELSSYCSVIYILWCMNYLKQLIPKTITRPIKLRIQEE